MRKVSVVFTFLMFMGFVILAAAIIDTSVSARHIPQVEDEVSRGAQLYDDWTQIVPAGNVPSGNHPIWSRQATNTRSGVDTWRCVSCHGWDYQGVDGAFQTGSNYSGFPGVISDSASTPASIRAALSGEDDPEHDFTPYLGREDISALAEFILNGAIDDSLYIDSITRSTLEGDMDNGKSKYESACASCHGADGTLLTFRYEGQNIALGTLAIQDPWRFLHRTRFGTARAPEMPLGVDLGWTEQDSRDVVFYAQRNLPSGLEPQEGFPLEITESENQGGPARNIFTGILTALSAMGISLGFAILVGSVFIGIILLLVWLIRSRQS